MARRPHPAPPPPAALRVRGFRSVRSTRRVVCDRRGLVPAACLRTPAGRPVCVDATVHHPIWIG